MVQGDRRAKDGARAIAKERGIPYSLALKIYQVSQTVVDIGKHNGVSMQLTVSHITYPYMALDNPVFPQIVLNTGEVIIGYDSPGKFREVTLGDGTRVINYINPVHEDEDGNETEAFHMLGEREFRALEKAESHADHFIYAAFVEERGGDEETTCFDLLSKVQEYAKQFSLSRLPTEEGAIVELNGVRYSKRMTGSWLKEDSDSEEDRIPPFKLDVPEMEVIQGSSSPRARVSLFKPSGKYYTEAEWAIPRGAIGPADMIHSPDFRRIDGGPVLVEEQEPWGYPHLILGQKS